MHGSQIGWTGARVQTSRVKDGFRQKAKHAARRALREDVTQ